MMTKFIGFLIVVGLIVVPLILKIKHAEHQLKKLKKQKLMAKNKHDKVQEALLTLQLRKNPSKTEIKEAHKKLMRQYHPDKGGSMFAATKINIARDILLEQVA